MREDVILGGKPKLSLEDKIRSVHGFRGFGGQGCRTLRGQNSQKNPAGSGTEKQFWKLNWQDAYPAIPADPNPLAGAKL
jgi:hypothetical protein